MRKTKDIGYQILALLLGIIVLTPVLYALSISFMRPEEILSRDVNLLPRSFYLGNYIAAFQKTTLARFLFNSLIMTVGSSTVRLVTAGTAAFALSFYNFRGKQAVFLLIIGTMMIPPDLLIVKNYRTVANMGLINTYLGMMVIFFVTALNIFVMRQHFLAYSKSIYEAAKMDGCTNFMFFIRVLLPSSKPVLITTFISSFVGVWNQYLWPLLVTNQNEMRTAQVAVTLLNFPDESPHGIIMAASILIVIPTVVVFLTFQRYIKKGMMAGGVKG
ncbi:carbohydrate ABC transporter permease [Vagococcus fessus]|uniref:ABC transporter permease n=1 Tax=Vagococcus fessus TaxID=120370 RepID=A0A430ABP1_9ENTE|nr:carbohydrate ABC transporter permease [Vagococcus fessus]RSU04601.1 ABC transporter permease [Vagococcus fessus]